MRGERRGSGDEADEETFRCKCDVNCSSLFLGRFGHYFILAGAILQIIGGAKELNGLNSWEKSCGYC